MFSHISGQLRRKWDKKSDSQSSECGNNSDFSTADLESENYIRSRLRNRNIMRVPDYVDRSSIVTDKSIY